MCIPILAAVIVLTAFLGWAMMNQQDVKSAARYTAWRGVYGGWPDADGNANSPDDPNHPGLNVLFFREKASSIRVDGWGGGGGTEEFEQFITAAGAYSDYAGSFADQLLMNPPPDRGHFQHARHAHVWAEFDSDLEAFRKYHGAIHARHIRDGVEWRRNQASCRHIVRLDFLQSLDDVLLNVASPGETMGEMMASTYRHGW